MSFLSPFPVFDINPSYEKVFTNFGEKEVKSVMGIGFLGWSVGYFYHFLKPAKRNIYIGTGLGVFVGTVTGYVSVSDAMKGYAPNERLLESYKPLTDRQIIAAYTEENKKNPVRKDFNFFKKNEEIKKHPMVSLSPSSKDVVLNFEAMDYVRMALSGAIFVTTGVLVYRFMSYGRKTEILDSVARETILSFLFLNGVYEGIVIEYNGGKNRLYGVEPNDNEVQKHGRINESRLIQNLLEINYPDIPFEDYLIKEETTTKSEDEKEFDRIVLGASTIDRFRWEEVLLNDAVLQLLPEALNAKFPNADFSYLDFSKLRTNSGKANQSLVKILEKHGYSAGAASRILQL